MPDVSSKMELRRALARFVTGVTVVTAAGPGGGFRHPPKARRLGRFRADWDTDYRDEPRNAIVGESCRAPSQGALSYIKVAGCGYRSFETRAQATAAHPVTNHRLAERLDD